MVLAPTAPGAAGELLLHTSLLNDRRRTAQYFDAIDRTVRPGDVVVDIGTGTGVLAMRAARAGARRVFAIEMGPVADHAERLLAANGMADRVELIRGRSYDVELPERADVLLSELIGHMPLAEGVIGVTNDAVERFLKPGARLVPDGVRLHGLPVTIPEGELSRLSVRPSTVAAWEEWYGLDFSALAETAADTVHYLNPHDLRHWTALSPPVPLATVDLRSWKVLWLRARQTVTATASGSLDGMLVSFDLMAGGEPFLSTCPEAVDEANHWLSPVTVFGTARPVVAGLKLALSYWSLVSGVSGARVRVAAP